MDLDDEAVRPAGRRRQGHGLDVPGHAGGVAGVYHHGQMGQLVEDRHGGQVQGIAGGCFEGADAPLTEDDILVAPGHNVLRAHQQLLDGVGQAALEKNGLLGLAQFLQKLKVLHVPGTHLDDVHVLEEGQVVGVHDFSDDGQTGFPLGLQQQLNAVGLQALEVVGGGTGLEGAAPEHGGPGCLDALGHGDDLLLALHRAWAGNEGEAAVAHLQLLLSHLDDGILGMELPVGALEGLGHPLDPLDNVQTGNEVPVQLAGVADDADDCGVISGGDMGPQVLRLNPVNQILYTLLFCVPCLWIPAASPQATKKTCGEVFFTAGLRFDPFSHAKVVAPLFAAKSTFTLSALKPKK